MAIISYQTALKNLKKALKKKINYQLDRLKNNEDTLACKVYELEARLNEHYDEVNIINCQKDKNWSLFHLERPTRNYCNLTKGSNKLSSLDNIKDTSDTPNIKIFENAPERNEHIKPYF